MRKHLLVALASVVIAGLCGQSAVAQQPGGSKGGKPKKTKTTPAPAAPSTKASPKAAATGFKEVTKAKFKEVYFRLGGGKRSGWTADYWQKFFEDEAKPGWKFMVEEPRSPRHVRMNIVTDVKAKEYRLFFMTEEEEEETEWPGK